MSDDEFNRLLAGPLSHPLGMFVATRLAIALRVVVEATGEAGADVLREHCRELEHDDGCFEPQEDAP